MAGKVEFIIRFLQAARSLANRGMSKEAIEQFARNEFGEINELFQKQIDNLFKQKQGIENIKIKDEVFDDTIVKLPIDDTGVPFNPKDPMKQYGKPKKTDDFNLSEDDPLGDLEKIIKGEGDTGLPKKPEDKATGGRAGYGLGSFVQRKGTSNQNQNMPAVDARMQNTYEQNTKLNQIQRNMNERMRKGSQTQGLEIGPLGDMYGKKQTEYNSIHLELIH